MSGDRGLKLIRTGSKDVLRMGKTIIEAASGTFFPDCQARVFEEDTFLVLSAPREVRDPGESMERVSIRAMNVKEHQQGNVLVREGSPLQLLAVIHDLNQEPTWTAEVVNTVLGRIVDICSSRCIRTLALPVLGSLYGTMDSTMFLKLLSVHLEKSPGGFLEKVLLQVSCNQKDCIGTWFEMFRSS